jgi:hypothetical protein
VSQPTHVAFADESQYNTGRYRAVALVSVPYALSSGARDALQEILRTSGMYEFKWSRLSGARDRFAALKLVEYAVARALDRTLRIDVVSWDIEDCRHDVPGRDDIANLQRMYYHLFKNVLHRRWPPAGTWRLHPDEQTALNWDDSVRFLEKAGSHVEVEECPLFPNEPLRVGLRRAFNIDDITTCKSHEEPLIQLADLFAGLSTFSRTAYARYAEWKEKKDPQRDLFATEPETPARFSRADEERNTVMEHLNTTCKCHKLGVSLKSSCGLRTFDPCMPLNFWHYTPQHDRDRAPQKRRKT